MLTDGSATLPHAIVIGGSSGIGFAFARLLVAKGWHVSLLARRPEPLAAASAILGPERSRWAAADVLDEAALHAAAKGCEAAFGACDLLIAAAGDVRPERFATQSAADFAAQVAVNLLGVAASVRAVYPSMVRRGTGRILIVSSGAALIGLPGYTGYCASKSALQGFSEALRLEARAHGIGVHLSLPPDTDTPQWRREMPLRPPEAALIAGTARPWSAERVARTTLAAMDRGRTEIPLGLALVLLHRFGSLVRPLPRLWFEWRLDRRRRRRGGG